MRGRTYYALLENNLVYASYADQEGWVCLSYDPNHPKPVLAEPEVNPNDEMNTNTAAYKYISQEQAERLIKESWRDAPEIEFEYNGIKCRTAKCIVDYGKTDAECEEFYKKLPYHQGSYSNNFHLCMVDGTLRLCERLYTMFAPKANVNRISDNKCVSASVFTYFRPIINVETGEFV